MLMIFTPSIGRLPGLENPVTKSGAYHVLTMCLFISLKCD